MIVYKTKNDILYKIYYQNSDIVENINLEGNTKIVDSIKEVHFNNKLFSLLNYTDYSGVQLSKEDAINMAFEKQSKSNLTNLPLRSIYIDNHFRGCVIKNYSHSFPIHNIPFFLLS